MALLIGATALASCDTVKAAQDALALQQQIQIRFGDSALVTLLGRRGLAVSLINSEGAALPEVEREHLALDVARFALANYARRDSLTKVHVFYMARSGMGGIHVSIAGTKYMWSAEELRRPAAEAPGLPAGVPKDSALPVPGSPP